MFVRDEVTRQMMRNIDGFLGSELSKLASLIGDSYVNVLPDFGLCECDEK